MESAMLLKPWRADQFRRCVEWWTYRHGYLSRLQRGIGTLLSEFNALPRCQTSRPHNSPDRKIARLKVNNLFSAKKKTKAADGYPADGRKVNTFVSAPRLKFLKGPNTNSSLN